VQNDKVIIYLYLFKVRAAKNKADLLFAVFHGCQIFYYNMALCNKDLDNAVDTLTVCELVVFLKTVTSQIKQATKNICILDRASL